MNRIVKLTLASLVAAASIICARAQTNTTPLTNFISGPTAGIVSDFFSGFTTNAIVMAYGLYDKDSKDWGGGLGLGYKVSQFVVPTLRLDYLVKTETLWMPSASVTLQAPITVLGKFTVIPFTFAGIATPIAGRGVNNGDPVAILGAGGAIRLGSKFDLLADAEKWNGAGMNDLQIRFGIGWKPKAW